MSLLKSLIVVFLSAAIVRVISAHNCQGTIGGLAWSGINEASSAQLASFDHTLSV